ncbi:MAG: hypothetical protein HY902_15105 [Deltaproteobacteria bacterium]|nr:hypothetical protein [Deltaproteobacteria bacterium]
MTVKPLGLLDIGGAKVVPGWLAHLYGKNLQGIGDFKLLEATVTNPDSVSHNYTVEVEIKGYSEVALASLKIPAKQTATASDFPLTWKAAWKALSGPLSTQIQVRVIEGASTLASDAVGVSLYPVNYVKLNDTKLVSGATVNGRQTEVTLVTPGDKDVQGLLSVAKSYSVFGAMIGYQYKGKKYGSGAVPAIAVTLNPDGVYTWPTWYEQGDPIAVDVSVTCSACVSYNAGYGVKDPAGNWILQWTELGSGLDATVAQTTGWYAHYAWNPAANTSTRSFTVKRGMALNEGARDQIGAIFKAVQDYGLGYVTVGGSFFSSAQYIKLPAESLNSSGANCIDGALLFASALEAMGMEPLLEFPVGHAFVAVRCWEGSSCIVPIETTMVGKNGSALDAVNAAIKEMPGVVLEVDVKAQRDAGFTPIPQ